MRSAGEESPAGSLMAKRENAIPAEWKMTDAGKKAVRVATSELTRIGRNAIIASIPMICRGLGRCPFKDSCTVEDTKEIVGSKCPLEVAELLTLMSIYAETFQLESLEGELDVVKMGLIRELIDCDIQMRRAEKRLSQEGDFLEEVNIGYNESAGEVITQRQISKPVEYKDKITERKHKILTLLNSTPKDKAADDRIRLKAEAAEKAKQKDKEEDFASYSARLYKMVQDNPSLMDSIRGSAIEIEISEEIQGGEDA